MKHRALAGLVASGVGLLLTLGFACVDADIPNISNALRDDLAETFANAGAASVGASGAAGDGGDGGSASAAAGAGGGGGSGGAEPVDEPSGGAAGSSMAGVAGSEGNSAAGAGGGAPVAGGDCDGFAVLEQYCATSGCHGDPGAPLGDFASSEEAARAFIDQEGTLSCGGQGAIINTDDPEGSVLVLKMSDDPPCGQLMPPGGPPLSDADVACVVEWISGL